MLEIISVTPAPKSADATARPNNKDTRDAGASVDQEQSFDAEYASNSEQEAEQIEAGTPQKKAAPDREISGDDETIALSETEGEEADAPALAEFGKPAEKAEKSSAEAVNIAPPKEQQEAPRQTTFGKAAPLDARDAPELDGTGKREDLPDQATKPVPQKIAAGRLEDSAPAAPEKSLNRSQKPLASAVETAITSKTRDQFATAGRHEELPIPAPLKENVATGAPPASAPAAAVAKVPPAPTRMPRSLPEDVVPARDGKHTDFRDMATQEVRPVSKAPAPHTPVAGAVVPIPVSRSVLSLQGDKLEAMAPLSSEIDTSFWEPRPAGSTPSTSLAQVISRADTPAMIGRQLAEALQRMPDRPVELSLNPSELGRVRMSISASEAGITVNVLTERPETLDLMRRNIDELAREFRDLGYETINFAFAEGRHDESGKNPPDTADTVSAIELSHDEEPLSSPPVPSSVSSGLDLRL